MTDKHYDCVYFCPNKNGGFCLLKQEKINHGSENRCPEMVLRPSQVLAYFFRHEGYCDEWICAFEKANKYLDKTGFNNYPKRR